MNDEIPFFEKPIKEKQCEAWEWNAEQIWRKKHEDM